jgi:hypothetical protein
LPFSPDPRAAATRSRPYRSHREADTPAGRVSRRWGRGWGYRFAGSTQPHAVAGPVRQDGR